MVDRVVHIYPKTKDGAGKVVGVGVLIPRQPAHPLLYHCCVGPLPFLFGRLRGVISSGDVMIFPNCCPESLKQTSTATHLSSH